MSPLNIKWKTVVHKANKMTSLLLFCLFRAWRSDVCFVIWKRAFDNMLFHCEAINIITKVSKINKMSKLKIESEKKNSFNVSNRLLSFEITLLSVTSLFLQISVYIDCLLLNELWYQCCFSVSSLALCLKALPCVCTQWQTSEMSSMDPSLTNMVTTTSGHLILAKSLTLAQGLWVLLMKSSLVPY